MKGRTAELLNPPADFHDIETLIGGRIREVTDEILDEDLKAALGAGRHANPSRG